MGRIFLWFYCLPIRNAVLLIVLATLAFLLLRETLGHTALWKTAVRILLICWIAVILYGTLGRRTGGSNPESPVLIPFYSYYLALTGGTKELYRTNFMNLVLFYPAGLLGCALLPETWKTRRKIALLVFRFALISICIECCQYRFGLGLAETDDLIHNTLGVVLGALAVGLSPHDHNTE